MPDPKRTLEVEGFGRGGGVGDELFPVVAVGGFVAEAVAAHVEREAAPRGGEAADDRIPDAGVKAGGVDEQQVDRRRE